MPFLDWYGRKAVENYHQNVPYHLLRCNEQYSVGESGGGNLLVQGDNLIALKALLPYYAGQVKCIYIDPPYNTGTENWVYNDNVNSPEIREWLGKVVGKEAEDLSRHDKWLCMIYPRLQLLRQFLREDGVILISIDDNEVSALRIILDEIFGRNNFIACLIWQKSKKGDAKLISISHEYIVIVAKNKALLTQLGTKWRKKKPGVDEVLSHYQRLRKELGRDHEEISRQMKAWYRSLPTGNPAKAHKHYNRSDDRGLYFPADFSGPDDGRENRPRYTILHPVTGKPCRIPSTGWRWEEARTLQAMKEDPPLIHFGADETTIPCRKSYLEQIDREPFSSVFYKDGRAGTLELEKMLGHGKMQFPKDSDVLAELIELVTGPEDLILDSFAGSGTTGQAVLKLNYTFEKSNRRFILIEMNEDISKNVTSNRLRATVEGYIPLTGRNHTQESGLGGSFRYCELAEPLFSPKGRINETVSYEDLAQHLYFVETGEPLQVKAKLDSPLIGVHNGIAIYLLYNGILKDRSVQGGNVLTTKVLEELPSNEGTKIIYGASCRIGADRLKREGIIFKQIPYEVRWS